MDLIPLCIAIFLFLISTCGGTDDRIIPGKPLSPGSTVVSGGGAFALGFFSPASSNATLYAGIWYNNIPNRTVLWVANRNSPIADPSSAFLALTDRSDLVVSDSVGGTLWTTDNNVTGVTGAAAVLLDSGNLVIQSRNGTAVWQSFDHPTGTIIPGMKIWLRRAVHASIDPIVAWKGPDDPSTGDFSLGSDSKAHPQLFMWHGSHPYCRSSLWSYPQVTGQYHGTFGSIFYHELVIAGSNVYVTFATSDSSLRTRGVLDNSGNVQVLSWGKGLSSGWTVLAMISIRGCNRYGTCGPFGYCDATEAVPTCKCLEGFDPVSGNISQGCRRKEALECGGGGELFLSLPGMKVPDNYLYFGNVSIDKCTALCSSNCSCTAYNYNNLTDRATSRCLLWMGELIDTGKLVNSGESLYLRIASSGAGSKRKSNALEIVLLVPASLLTLICICLVWIRTCRGQTRAKQRCKKFWERKMQGDLGVSDELGDGKLEFPFLRFREIAVATNNFADSNMLGRGGFGNVYKGMLEGGTEIAVKRLSRSSGQGIVEFRNEVILIAKLQHRSLVKLLGCCIHGDEKLLIYEYLPNKSLDAFLFNDARKSVLDWPTRFKIIKGVARGLLYLHQDSRLTIIHRDLKASNILLDADMSPKISDFGMARIFGSDQQHENTNRVVGTYGYMSPEYALEGAFSVKSDVYSFGVLLLEIVSGIKISSTHQLFTDFPNLKAYAWSMWNDGKTKHLVDSLILESCSLDEVLRCVHLGLLCVQDDPNDRPLMSSSVFILENGATALPAPKQPIYYAQRNHGSDKVGENIEHTVNDMSLTGLEGR